jgi:hypothetical protein
MVQFILFFCQKQQIDVAFNPEYCVPVFYPVEEMWNALSSSVSAPKMIQISFTYCSELTFL